DRLGDRHVVEARRSERGRTTAVEVGGDDEQLVRELAEVVGAAGLAEPARVICSKRAVVEQAVRQAARKPHKRFDEPARGRRPEIRECGRLHEFGQPHQPAREVTESRTQQNIRLERVVVRPVEYEHRSISLGEIPLARPAARKAPELTPTYTSKSVSVRPFSAFSSATSAPIS